jgi:nucleoside-diphosphate-sugar epimerase
MSTAVVYGLGLPDLVEERQEDTPLRRTGEIYADGKAKAEREIDRAVQAGLRAVILRPQVVYGPEMRWSAELLRLLAAGRLSIVSDGGICNLIYVDDLVRAVDRALSADVRPGARFFVTDGRPRAWADYIDAHARLLGVRAPRHPCAELLPPEGGFAAAWRETMSRAHAVIATTEFRALVTEAPLLRDTVFRAYLALRDRSEAVAALARTVRQTSMCIDEGSPVYERHWAEIQLSRARLSSRRAAEGLGFIAVVDFEDGLRRTVEWSVAEGLLPAAALEAS